MEHTDHRHTRYNGEGPHGQIDGKDGEIARLKALVKDAKEWLEQAYVHRLFTCRYEEGRTRCVCGLDELLERMRGI